MSLFEGVVQRNDEIEDGEKRAENLIDLGRGEPEVPELGKARGEGLVDLGAEEERVVHDNGGDVVVGEAEIREEGEDGLGLGGGLEAGEDLGGLEGLRRGEVARRDEVVLHGERGRASRRCHGGGGGGGGGESGVGEEASVGERE